MAKLKFDVGIHVIWIVGAALLFAGEARAAPQVLALITTDQPVVLTCDVAECRAELPTCVCSPSAGRPRRAGATAWRTVNQWCCPGETPVAPLYPYR